MTRLFEELKGKKCIIKQEGDYSTPIECKVCDVDDDWVKIIYADKKKGETTKLLRIDNIRSIDEIENINI